MAEFDISIHALLAESDRGAGRIQRHRDHFYPRSPCGERLNDLIASRKTECISIHALLAESDSSPNTDIIILDISIHALLAESDILGRRLWHRQQFLYILQHEQGNLAKFVQ